MRLLAIDPGCTDSGYALIDSTDCRPLDIGKIPNQNLLDHVMDLLIGNGPTDTETDWAPGIAHVAIEMVASYGMPVGREVFETCVWVGRYQQMVDVYGPCVPCDLVYRRDVKLHHCHTSKANDANISQALVDRFASGQPNRGKGTKANPGWFFGFAADVWQAFALAVLVADRLEGRAA